MRNRFWIVLGFVATALAAAPTRAADPQPYSVAIVGEASGDLKDALDRSALLETLHDVAPAGPFALIERAREDEARLAGVLESYGYYRGQVAIAIDGHAIADPDLPQILDAVSNGTSVAVRIAVDNGPLYRLRKIEIDGDVPADARAALKLSPGQPAIAADIVAGGARLLNALQEQGHALADVGKPIAYADDEAHAIDVTFKVEAGPRVAIGAIAFAGLKDVNERFARASLTVHTGDLYQPSAIEKARQTLADTGVFSSVGVSAGKALDAQGRIPLTFTVSERPKHAVTLTAQYSTDLGASLGATWSHRNLFGDAEQLNLSATGTGLGGSDVNGLGYDLKAQYIQPLFLQRDQSLEADLEGLKQDLDAYDQQAILATVLVQRKLTPEWIAGVGVSVMQDKVNQEGFAQTYQLVALPLSVSYDSTGLSDPLAEPVHGIRAALKAVPTHAFADPGASFAILQASGSAYFDVSGDGRSVLALRALLGSIEGATQFDVPPDQRFYAGGSATVRGYKYQSIGPLFADGNPQGATSVDAGTIEFRQRLDADFGAAAFVDAGQASGDTLPFSGTMRVGVGAGVRYYTSIGPVRLDVAVPLNRPPQGDGFELYIGLGQAF